MIKSIYEITYIVVTDSDGLVSHKLKGIKEVMEDEEEEEDES